MFPFHLLNQLGEQRCLAQGHRDSEDQSRDSEPGLVDSEAGALCPSTPHPPVMIDRLPAPTLNMGLSTEQALDKYLWN